MSEREKTESIVARYMQQDGKYQVVSRADAKMLLGDDLYDRLLHDRIRNAGPSPDSLYPWNVVDYLQNEDTAIHDLISDPEEFRRRYEIAKRISKEFGLE